jgi:16S rRNA (adenine1518-N6/adenine1519-N6)-dimethyltransferase
MISALQIGKDDLVIEIGPGDGSVTKRILEKEAKLISIEIDYDLLAKLLIRFKDYKNFDLVHEDILLVNLSEVLSKYDNKNIKVIGSLPYNISKRIIDKFLKFNFEQSDYKIEAMCFIVQDEVAKSYSARPPQASSLSIITNLFTEVKKLESIPASQFHPKPKVGGGIIYFKPRESIDNKYLEIKTLLRIGFSSPRKKLISNIENSNKYENSKLLEIFEQMGLSTDVRASELTLEQWSELESRL